jgi:hypothetical protein
MGRRNLGNGINEVMISVGRDGIPLILMSIVKSVGQIANLPGAI